MNRLSLVWLLLLGLAGCRSSNTDLSQGPPLFELVPVSVSSVHFNNRIVENDTLNILDFEYVYNGAGVGIGDFNADGKPDVFFAGNQVDNALYLNKGDFQFDEVAQAAGVTAPGRWCTGVAIADVNADGYDDIYLGNSVHKPAAARANLLYINQGPDAAGIPHFTESAAAYGLADEGHSTHAVFLDYDRDGDLDLYVLTNEMEQKRTPNRYRYKKVAGENPNTDRLYRNNGDQTFTNVSTEAGITIEGYGLGVGAADFNRDGWPDIYVSNDYLTNDLIYINQQDGTFRNEAANYLRHTSYSAMGNDIADVNNDGLIDVIAVDMLPATQERKKQMIGESGYMAYINNDKYKYEHQYIRNTLQVNQGISSDAASTFAEIGQMAGLEETDWSWSPLLVDVDLDGDRDALISNGFPRDVTDHDFGFYRVSKEAILDSKEKLQDLIPEVKIANYAFENGGQALFSNRTKAWGLDRPSFSHGAAYADLDGDGDWDYITNNMGDSAFIYRNLRVEQASPESPVYSLQLQLEGPPANKAALGAQIWIYTPEGLQYAEQSPYRGYMSTVSTTLIFGLGSHTQVDSLKVLWPDGRVSRKMKVAAGVLRLSADEASDAQPAAPPPPALLQKASWTPDIAHTEADKIDFNLQRTLPHKYTQSGPGMAAADVNQDGRTDLLIGGAADKAMQLWLGEENGSFGAAPPQLLTQAQPSEDMGLLLFDADGDGDQDLYRVKGSYEFQPGSPLLQDELWRNDGGGIFSYDSLALPKMLAAGSCVRAADMDADGDLDLFVGGQVVPGAYPLPAQSALLQNNGGRFEDVSEKWFPQGAEIGLIQDALWTDVDLDGRFDLLLAGRWMAPTWYRNTGTGFEDQTEKSGLAAYTGWWNSINGADIDRDGDIDYVLGNWGLNSSYCATPTEPMQVYANDFDGNGSVDAVIGCYFDNAAGEREAYAVHTRLDLIKQLNAIRGRYPTFAAYGSQPFDQLLTKEEKAAALYAQATHMQSSYLENLGDGTFALKVLPLELQTAPVYGMLIRDFNADGWLDIMAVGNDYGVEVLSGRHDAFSGLVLLGNGKGDFEPLSIAESGFYIPGDGKSLIDLGYGFLAAQNQGPLQGYTFPDSPAPTSAISPDISGYTISYPDGKQGRVELYYGSGFLSQSLRQLFLPAGAKAGSPINWAAAQP